MKNSNVKGNEAGLDPKVLAPKQKMFKYSAAEKRDFLFIYLLILVPVLHFLIFWFYVNASSFVLSFQSAEGAWGFENFKLVGDFMFGPKGDGTYKFFDLLGNSFALYAIANFLAFPIGVMTTYVLFRKVSGHYFFRICYSIPSIVGSVVWVAFIKQLFAGNGAVIYILKNVGVEFESTVLQNGLFAHSSTAFPALMILTFMTGIAGGNVVLTGAYSRIPTELYEVGQLDGIGFWKEFFKVAVPCVWPTIATLITFSLCSMFVSDGNVYLYTNGQGDHGTATMGFYFTRKVRDIGEAASKGNSNLAYGYISAVGLVITAVTVPVVLFGRWLLEKLVEPVET